MKKRSVLMAMVGLAALLAGCDKNDDGGGNKNIKVPDQTQLEQVVTADETEGASGVKFTTTGPWTSSIAEVDVKGSASDWVSISPDRGSEAGEYTLQITLRPNETGEARKAQIKILCDGSIVTITVEQKGVGQPAGDVRRVQKLHMWDPDGDHDVVEFAYDAQGRVSGYKTYRDGTTLAYEAALTYAGTKITCVSTNHDDDEVGPDPIGKGPIVYTEVYTLAGGRVVSARGTGLSYDSDSWTYDANGYKSTWTERYETGASDGTTQVRSDVSRFEWSGGNMTRETIEEAGVQSPRTVAYRYTDRTVKPTSIDLNAVLCADALVDMIGLAGKPSKHVLDQWTLTGDQWEKDNGTTKYRYEFDQDGYVKKIYSTWTEAGAQSDPEILCNEVIYQ